MKSPLSLLLLRGVFESLGNVYQLNIIFERLSLSVFCRTSYKYLSHHFGETDCDRQSVIEVAGIIVDFCKPHDVIQYQINVGKCLL